MSAIFIQALSLFWRSWEQIVESHPPSAEAERPAVVTANVSTTSRSRRWCRFTMVRKMRTDVNTTKKVECQRRLKRTSSIGLKMTDQKLADMATAVIAAILDTGTCSAASNCGMTKKTVPLVRPRVVLERPINQTGGTRRLDF